MIENDEVIMQMMQDLLKKLRASKPEDRSETARRYAVTITEMEKVMAYFHFFLTVYPEVASK